MSETSEQPNVTDSKRALAQLLAAIIVEAQVSVITQGVIAEVRRRRRPRLTFRDRYLAVMARAHNKTRCMWPGAKNAPDADSADQP